MTTVYRVEGRLYFLSKGGRKQVCSEMRSVNKKTKSDYYTTIPFKALCCFLGSRVLCLSCTSVLPWPSTTVTVSMTNRMTLIATEEARATCAVRELKVARISNSVYWES
jgi:hypothetical protein